MIAHYGYVRVSTAKQGEGVSIDAQKEAILAYAARSGLTISQWFEEKETAAKQGRPIFNAMVKALRQRKALGLVVHKIDRSARNFKDWARIGDLADEGFDIHFANETLDFRSRGGRLSADIQAVIAADYIRNLREETIKGINGRLKQGLFPFGAPIGYLDNGGGKPKTPDPVRAPFVQEMFRLYASGRHSLRTLITEMTHLGLTNCRGNPPSKRLIETALSNPFYCGIIRIGTTGETYQGVHEPLIDVATFDRVQYIKAGKCGKKVVKHDFLFRGLFKCADCGYAMIAERQKGHVYYRCHTSTCPTTAFREEQIDQAVADVLATLRLTHEAREALVNDVSDWVNEKICSQAVQRDKSTGIAEIDARLDRLTDALVDHLIDKDVYAARRERLLLEKADLEQQHDQSRDLKTAVEDVRKFLELAKNLTGLYETLNQAERRVFVEITTSNRMVSGKKLEIEPSDWLQVLPGSRAVPFGDPSRPKSRRRHHPNKCWVERLVEAARAENTVNLNRLRSMAGGDA